MEGQTEANRIVLIIEGLESDNGHVSLDRFLTQLKKLAGSLDKIDTNAGAGKPGCRFVVTGLSHNSPARVEIEARPRVGQPDIRPIVLGTWRSLARSVQTGQIPPDVDHRLLENMRDLAAPVGRDMASSRVIVEGDVFELTEGFARRIDAALADVEYCYGTVEGMLEQINVHAGKNDFTIYPEFGPSHVACHFRAALEEKALAGIKRKVSVSGRLKYRRNAPFPHHIDAEQIDIYPDVSQLPTFYDLRGIAKGVGNDQPSEDIIRDIRNAW